MNVVLEHKVKIKQVCIWDRPTFSQQQPDFCRLNSDRRAEIVYRSLHAIYMLFYTYIRQKSIEHVDILCRITMLYITNQSTNDYLTYIYYTNWIKLRPQGLFDYLFIIVL